MRHPYFVSTVGCLAVLLILLLADANNSKDLVKRGGVILIIVALCMLYREVFVGRRAGSLRELAELATRFRSRGRDGSVDPLTKASSDAAETVNRSAKKTLEELERARSSLIGVHCAFAIVGEILHGFGDLLFEWTRPWTSAANALLLRALF